MPRLFHSKRSVSMPHTLPVAQTEMNLMGTKNVSVKKGLQCDDKINVTTSIAPNKIRNIHFTGMITSPPVMGIQATRINVWYQGSRVGLNLC